jgi:crossover junction endodeoxyribonuclease RusA
MLEIRVFGDPAPQGSKNVYNGRVVESNAKRLKPWRAAVVAACQNLQSEEPSLLLGPVRVEVDFYLRRPASVKLSKRSLPIVPPDLDKLVRGVGDSLTQSGVIYQDDSQIVQLIATKQYADDTEPGATIRVIAL